MMREPRDKAAMQGFLTAFAYPQYDLFILL